MTTDPEDGTYLTVAGEASSELVIEKSRFIAYISPADTKEAAEKFIDQIRNKHKDATHNVPAYIIGRSQEIMWSSEDGEPQGTAGAPVLKMLVQEGLSDVCVVVTRYFGGIKLGTGGLVRAYTAAAKDALSRAGRAEVKDMLKIRASCDYKTYNRIASFDFEGKASVGNPLYSDKVEFDYMIPPEDEDELTERLKDISGGQVQILEKLIVQNKIMC